MAEHMLSNAITSSKTPWLLTGSRYLDYPNRQPAVTLRPKQKIPGRFDNIFYKINTSTGQNLTPARKAWVYSGT
jgi:hypothetical protein